MPILTFFTLLANKLSSAAGLLKVLFKDAKGQAKEASPEYVTKYGKMVAAGDISIRNINPIIVFNMEYPKDEKEEILKQISDEISGHSGVAVSFDKGILVASGTALEEVQKGQIKSFRKAGWSKDKIASIKIAFKIINLEDGEMYEETKQLMNSAFSGRQGNLNRKFYNLARAGYLDRFALDLMFSSSLQSDDAISQIIDYFPEALFLDQDFQPTDMISSLEQRKKERIVKISIYARGRQRINMMNTGYTHYLNKNVNSKDNSVGKPLELYMIDSKTSYKIGDSQAERLDVVLREFVLK